MIKCPVCSKNIHETDEICPYCKTDFNEMVDNLKSSNSNNFKFKMTNAMGLNIMAWTNLFLMILGAIVVFANYSTIETPSKYSWGTPTTEPNIIGISVGIALLINAFTFFFFLQTIKDIAEK